LNKKKFDFPAKSSEKNLEKKQTPLCFVEKLNIQENNK